MKEYNSLLQNLKKGDEQAYKSLFYAFFSDLVLYANGFIKNREAAEDIIQELFVNFWHNKIYNQIESGLNSYLFRAVRNSCLNYLRDEKYRNEKLSSVPFDESEDTLLYNDVVEQREEIYKAIHSLPPQCKQIFMLCCMEGLKYQETADRLGISINTVRTQMGRAFKFLREALKDKSFSAFLLFLRSSAGSTELFQNN